MSKAQIAEAVTEAVSAKEGTAILKLKKGEAVVKAEADLLGPVEVAWRSRRRLQR